MYASAVVINHDCLKVMAYKKKYNFVSACFSFCYTDNWSIVFSFIVQYNFLPGAGGGGEDNDEDEGRERA